MKYESRITCFLDILGFKEHINKTVNTSGDDVEEEIEKISEALLQIRSTLDIDKHERWTNSKIVTQFSDCIVISFSTEEESAVFNVLLQIQLLLLELFNKGFLCRGGIAYGKLIHSKEIVYGPALVEAYKMESEAALYPRVILHESIIELGGENSAPHHSPEVEKEYIKQIVNKDSDGMYYIDFFEKAIPELDDDYYTFHGYLVKAHSLIEKGLEAKSPGVLIKFRWLKEKYNKVILTYQDEKLSWNNDELEKAYKKLQLL